MPVERRSGVRQTTAIAIGVAALIACVGIAWLVINLASRGDGPIQMNLGDDVFDAGDATRLAAQVEQDGPLLFSDVSGRGQVRPIVVNHFGDDPQTGWVAFDAAPDGADRGCFLAWSTERNLFEERQAEDGAGQDQGDVCRKLEWAANGDPGPGAPKLATFPTRVDTDGVLIVDLKPDDDATDNSGG